MSDWRLPSGWLMALALALWCDPFQLVYRTGPDVFYVAYSRVTVLGAHGDTVFAGTTDRYGRIQIGLPTGTYRAEVSYRGNRRAFQIAINGTRELRIVEIR